MLAREDDTGQSPRPAWRGGRPRRPRLDTLHPVRRPGPVQLGRELRRQLRPDELGARARPDAAGQEWHREYGSGAPRGPEESPCAWLPRTGRSDPRPGGEAGPPSLPPPPSYVLCVIRAWACWGAPLPGAREPSQQIRVRTQEPAGPPPRCLRPHLPDGFEVGPGARRPLCSGGSGPSHSPTWGAARHDGWGLPNLLSRHRHQPHSGRRRHGPGLAETVARAVADLRPQTAGHSCDPRSSRQSRPDGCPRVLTSWTQTPPRGSGRVPGVRPSQAVQDWPAWGTPRSARPASPALPVRAVLTGLLPRAGQPWPQPWSAVAGARRRVSPPSSPRLLGGNLDAPHRRKSTGCTGKSRPAGAAGGTGLSSGETGVAGRVGDAPAELAPRGAPRGQCWGLG